ncbi:MAG: helix-turn-helix transcriptional regulator [Clostridia bacterium]|nr:helix-turn-helix transcriptional regulator [Clostridia bacterium]
MAFIEFEKSVKKNDWSMNDLHSHSHYEIYFLSKGSRHFFLSNALYKLTAPVLLVIPPHVMHKTEGGPFERFNLNVGGGDLDSFQKESLEKNALRLVSLNPEEAKALTQLFEEVEKTDKRDKHSGQILRAYFSYFCVLLYNLHSVKLPDKKTENNMPPLVLKIVDYLNGHYDEKITLEELAQNFFVSKATLLYNFKKYTNCSPIDFLINVRLTKAKELLTNTKKSVQEISELCGFSSANYFGLLFKQKEKLSPAGYRKLQQQKI